MKYLIKHLAKLSNIYPFLKFMLFVSRWHLLLKHRSIKLDTNIPDKIIILPAELWRRLLLQ